MLSTLVLSPRFPAELHWPFAHLPFTALRDVQSNVAVSGVVARQIRTDAGTVELSFNSN
jgi:hypothetical protein